MNNDINYGTRDERGDWKPFKIDITPSIINYFTPFRPLKILNYFVGYPIKLIWLFIALISWYFFTPSYEVLKDINFDSKFFNYFYFFWTLLSSLL